MRFTNKMAVLVLGGGGVALGSIVGFVGLLAMPQHLDTILKFAGGIMAGGLFLAQAFMRPTAEEPVKVRVGDGGSSNGGSGMHRLPTPGVSPMQLGIPMEVEAENTGAVVRTMVAVDEALRSSRSNQNISPEEVQAALKTEAQS
jgi:hypothetical protein